MSEERAAFLRVLAVDDEPPALDELAYLLRADPRVTRVHTANDATDALRVLRDTDVDAVFLDIRMPGLDGMELARVLRRFSRPPAIVFVTAYDWPSRCAGSRRRGRCSGRPVRPTPPSRWSWRAPRGCCRARRCAGWRRR